MADDGDYDNYEDDMDDVDEDAAWLGERVWGKDRNTFPETVTIDGEIVPCF